MHERRDRELGPGFWILNVIITAALMVGFLAWADHSRAHSDHVWVEGRAIGDPAAPGAVAIRTSVEFDEVAGDRAARTLVCGDSRFRFAPGVNRLPTTMAEVEALVGRRCTVVSGRARSEPTAVDDGILERPNRRTCRLQNLPCGA